MTGNGKPARGLRGAAGTARLGWVNHNGPLRDVLGGLAGTLAGGTALLSTPTEFVVARIDADGGCHTPARPVKGVDRAVDFAYEARVFTTDVELRWVRRGVGGNGVLLGEEVCGGEGVTGGEATGLRVSDADSGYLLWGRRLRDPGVPEGWAVLSAARVGTVYVPVDAAAASSSASRLRLRVREYIAVDGPGAAPDGNPAAGPDGDRGAGLDRGGMRSDGGPDAVSGSGDRVDPGSGDGVDPDGSDGDGEWDVGWHGNAYVFDERLIGFEAGEFIHGC